MSEVLNANVTSSEENSFSRRRVVKGVAWSLPVIATAIAAPAAAASPTFSITAGASGPITISKEQGTGSTRGGQGPSVLTVQNNSGATLTGTIGIVPAVNSGAVNSGIAVKSLTGGTVGAATFSATHVSTASFSIPVGQPANRAISFYYVDGKGQSAPTVGQKYTFTLTLTVGSTVVVIPGITMDI